MYQNADISGQPAADSPSKLAGFMARMLSELRFFAGLAVVMLALLTLAWGHYKIPSESMQPTLEVGDHIYVSKFAYGYSRHSLPFGLHVLPLPEGQLLSRLPKRGDVVVFRNPNNGTVMIKRAIGLPGDEIQVVNGRVVLNGTVLRREMVAPIKYRVRDGYGTVIGATIYSEIAPGEDKPHLIFEQTDHAPLDNTDIYVVPKGHIFMMGDNRERSVDSRLTTTDPYGRTVSPSEYGPGFVPLDHLIGRADLLMFTFNRCNRDEDLRCPDKGRAPGRL